MKTVITIGEIVAEIMACDAGNGFLQAQSLTGPYPSGAPAIFIDQVAKLGLPSAIISAVGQDDLGTLNVERLKADGVDVSAIRVDARLATGIALVRYRFTGERDFVFNLTGAACSTLTRDAAAEKVIAAADHLHVMGSSLFSPAVAAVIEYALAQIKARGGTVSFDPNGRKEMLELPGMREAMVRILGKTDIYLPSGDELTLLTQANSQDEAITELLDVGVTAIVVKRARSGATYHDRSGSCTVAPLRVDSVDPTGAGDSFAGAFVAGWLSGLVPERCLRLANAAGARAVTARGPMEGTSTLTELETFLSQQSCGVTLS